MAILIQHAQKQYVRKNCPGGFCNERKLATEFKTIFIAMKYLMSQNEESIEQYNFIENDNQRKNKHSVKTERRTCGRHNNSK